MLNLLQCSKYKKAKNYPGMTREFFYRLKYIFFGPRIKTYKIVCIDCKHYP